jgi:hypothetical protein
MLALCLGSLACTTPDPKKVLVIEEIETYYAIDNTQGDTLYLAPAVKLKVRNASAQAQHAVEVTCTFRRKGEEWLEWGTAWERIPNAPGKALGANEAVTLMLKSDKRYYSQGQPEGIFKHELFKDVLVEIFFRVGSSGWTQMEKKDIDRQIGSKTGRALAQ